MNIRLLHLAEHEGTCITDALNDDLWKLLKLDVTPPPVLFKRFQGDWDGLCCSDDKTHAGEVELNEALTSTTRTTSTALAKRALVRVYMHEWAHRLTEGHGHDAVFAAVNLALLIRADPAHLNLAITGLKLYDFHDHSVGHEVMLPDAAAFVMRHGIELGNSALPVSVLASAANARFDAFRAELKKRSENVQEVERLRLASASLQNAHSATRKALCGLYGTWGMIAIATAFIQLSR